MFLRDARDLPVPLPLDVTPGADLGEDPRGLFLVTPVGFSTICFEDEDDATHAELLARVADLAHDWVLEQLPDHGLPSNWPPCPRHPRNHPLVIPDEQQEVVWACPTTGEVVALVGHLR
ncbi:hypothetical protein GCM10023226_03040 [Nocardioides nanhaiensis]|uniref:Uncharacterized protein n=2 Tax=Nocardioides nanhaiensis TaxID=1476871 RepID=A0ABP8VRZ7_9ACTN